MLAQIEQEYNQLMEKLRNGTITKRETKRRAEIVRWFQVNDVYVRCVDGRWEGTFKDTVLV
jgi:hypothetical protein